MLWFNGKKRMEFIENFIPTSKVQLKRACLLYHRGDIKKAQEMYEYYSKDIDLPDVDPVQPTTLEQVKNGAVGFMDFVKEHQGDLMQGYNLIHHMITNKGELPTMEVAPPDDTLPPINK